MDRIAIEDLGIPGYTLMQRAGSAAVRAARVRFPDARRWQVLCGSGNNGGDGYVVARLAAEEGIAASVVTLVDPATLSGDAATAYADFKAAGGTVAPWAGELDADAQLLVDAILGRGLERDVGGVFADAVKAINAHPAAVHAMDIATGINGDSGRVMGSAVKATLTTTFVALKSGLFLGAGPTHCGEVNLARLDIGAAALAAIPATYRRINSELLGELLAPRARDAHKGDFGHVLVVAGAPGMPGAASLCGEATLRVGAGRVSLATHPEHAAAIAAARPELMCHGVHGADDLSKLLESADIVAFGPGLGQSDWARELYAVLRADARPAVWDADALNLLAQEAAQQTAQESGIAKNRIVTPHPGEAATLLGCDSAAVQRDRPAALAALAERYGGVAVLKGAGTLVSDSSGAPFVCASGNPGMAAPGMGDVLAGVIAALLGQGLSLTLAAAVGVELHARAGDLAAKSGERGLLASDLIFALRAVANP